MHTIQVHPTKRKFCLMLCPAVGDQKGYSITTLCVGTQHPVAQTRFQARGHRRPRQREMECLPIATNSQHPGGKGGGWITDPNSIWVKWMQGLVCGLPGYVFFFACVGFQLYRGRLNREQAGRNSGGLLRCEGHFQSWVIIDHPSQNFRIVACTPPRNEGAFRLNVARAAVT